MAAIVWSDVVAAAPELSTTNATTQNDVVNVANVILDVTQFDGEAGPQTRLARIMVAAHFAALAKLGTGGPIATEGVAGVLSRGYHLPGAKSEWMTTSYGRTFWLLIGSAAKGPILL